VPLIHEDLQFIDDGLKRSLRNHSTTALQISAAWHITFRQTAVASPASK
jgi:hypothetical protein